MATLSDLGSEPFETALDDDLPVTAIDCWVVLSRAGAGPVSVVAPGMTLARGARPPAILVAAADLDQATAFGSAAFQEFMEVSALVLTTPAEASGNHLAVAGVVSDVTLTRGMQRGGVRGETVLPGAPSVPWITRSCGYAERRATCATALSFQRRPVKMPLCPNDRGLAAHSFTW
jgi:hypothetical protein